MSWASSPLRVVSMTLLIRFYTKMSKKINITRACSGHDILATTGHSAIKMDIHATVSQELSAEIPSWIFAVTVLEFCCRKGEIKCAKSSS